LALSLPKVAAIGAATALASATPASVAATSSASAPPPAAVAVRGRSGGAAASHAPHAAHHVAGLGIQHRLGGSANLPAAQACFGANVAVSSQLYIKSRFHYYQQAYKLV